MFVESSLTSMSTFRACQSHQQGMHSHWSEVNKRPQLQNGQVFHLWPSCLLSACSSHQSTHTHLEQGREIRSTEPQFNTSQPCTKVNQSNTEQLGGMGQIMLGTTKVRKIRMNKSWGDRTYCKRIISKNIIPYIFTLHKCSLQTLTICSKIFTSFR